VALQDVTPILLTDSTILDSFQVQFLHTEDTRIEKPQGGVT